MPTLPPCHVPLHATPRTSLLHRPLISNTDAAKDRYTGRWRSYAAHYLRAQPLCADCKQAGIITPATQVDHIVPCTSDRDPNFWLTSNHQPLCRPCHGRKTRSEHIRGRGEAISRANRPFTVGKLPYTFQQNGEKS